MTGTLPLHAASADEEMAALGLDRWAGPEMRNVEPIDAMLARLAQLDDDEDAYLVAWRLMVKSVGGTAYAEYDKNGDIHLSIGVPCDAQMRHRWRWTCLLSRDLDRSENRRPNLLRQLKKAGWVIDLRPCDVKATTKAIRQFIRAGGRILVTPEGQVEEGAGVPRAFLDGNEDEAAQCMRASRAYLNVRRRLRSDTQIKRAARMLGRRTDNGWWVLEAARA